METHVQRLLQDKLYDKRKAGALELEAQIRNCVGEGNHERIERIVKQLCHEYAYSIHQPHARNGGLIGLAAAAIALGPEVARHLKEIVPPVLACFSDQDARVRYYACESMYNIAKVAKGEILVYFNDVFDALSKLAADTELSVKNGAELLDRLVKDIVSESAATYASVLLPDATTIEGTEGSPDESIEVQKAFSLSRFIPLLRERINVQNPFARTFLVSWITLLDQIPDLELVVYLPSFLGGLLRFLSDSNEDVHTTTKTALDRFIVEIKKIAAVQKEIGENRRIREEAGRKTSGSSLAPADTQDGSTHQDTRHERGQESPEHEETADEDGRIVDGTDSFAAEDIDEEQGLEGDMDDEWIPGQDVHIDYPKIVEILVNYFSETREEEVQVTALKWIETFLEICPENILAFTPKLLQQVLPALSHDKDIVSQAAHRVNQLLMVYIVSLPEEPAKPSMGTTELSQIAAASAQAPPATSNGVAGTLRLPTNANGIEKRESVGGARSGRSLETADPESGKHAGSQSQTPEPPNDEAEEDGDPTHTDLDYEAAVGALTLQFLHEHEATRVAALAWLIMLHRKSPRKILAIQDATFPALLKTLSDPAEAVVTRDLILLSQISKSSDDSYFTSFMVNLLKLFCTDRRLLETRGNLIIRQLCLSLSAERIYRTMADCLERDEDIEFASIMVQNLNNNLITAPELADLRKRLRNLDSRDGQTFFTVLFRAWCVNAVATFSLCLLAQAYEQAYNLLQIFCEIEMTVNMLIQIDKLVQLLESPVFTYLRMQLLEPERHPNLYKCLYGLLMLLPQSSAFAALKNRLNSVSAIGYLHIGVRGAPTTPSSVSTFERQNRLKSREEGGIKWTELLEKFRSTQEKVRKTQQRQLLSQHGLEDQASPTKEENEAVPGSKLRLRLETPSVAGTQPGGASLNQMPPPSGPSAPGGHTKGKSSLSNLGRFTGGVRAGKAKK